MRLSLCMIVKNEAENLPRLFQSMSALPGRPDEVCIVDTGSADATPALARQYADHYRQIEWTGFADARNASLDMASGDYILILDADEYLDDPDFFLPLRGAMTAGVLSADLVVVSYLGKGSTDTIYQTRLFKNDGRVRYDGKVHNQITFALKEVGGEQVRLGSTIHHTGYDLTKEQRLKKYLPRLDLYDAMLQDAKPADAAYYRYQLGGCLFMCERYAEAAETLMGVDEAMLSSSFLPHLLTMAGKAYLQTKDYKAALSVAQHLVRIKEDGTSLNMLGVALMTTGDTMGGLEAMCKAYLAPRNGRFTLSEEAFRASFAELYRIVGAVEPQRFFLNAPDHEVKQRVRQILTSARNRLEHA